MPSLHSTVLLPAVVLTLSLSAPLALDSRVESAPRPAAPCAQWNQFGNWLSNAADGTMAEPSSPWFHTRSHTSYYAPSLLHAGMGMLDDAGRPPTRGAYAEALFGALINLFGPDLQFLAEANGFSSHEDLLGEHGLRALDGVVDFDTEVYSTESTNYCATVHPITQGAHKGEFLVVARDKSSGRVIGVAIAGTVDEARAIAADMLEEAEKEREGAEAEGVVAFPDGCGDVRMPPGFGC